MARALILSTALFFLPFLVNAQAGSDSSGTVNKIFSLPGKSLDFISRKYNSLTEKINRQALKALNRMQQREARLREKVALKDSAKAQQLFGYSGATYTNLQGQLTGNLNTANMPALKEYLPGIDSTQTMIQFLSSKTPGGGSLNTGDLAKIGQLSGQVQQLEGRLQQANDVQGFLQEREQQLQQQLSGSGLSKQLLGLNQDVFNYQQQLQQYKDLLNNKEKLEQLVLSKVTQIPAFQNFWQRNSIFSSIFPMPQSSPGTSATAIVAGIPTRSQVQNAVIGQIPQSDGSGSTGFMQQQIENGQDQVGGLQSKLNQLMGGGSGTAGSGNTTMPAVTPDGQQGKSFLKRLFVNYTFQAEPATPLLPSITDLGINLGYKISDKAQIGTGVAYKLGTGRGLTDISFSSQGVSLRSFVNVRLKGSIWVSGGYEYDYLQAFAKLADLRNINLWQRSALLGLMKTYKIGKKDESVSLLYNFLANTQVPAGPPLVFRFGYSF